MLLVQDIVIERTVPRSLGYAAAEFHPLWLRDHSDARKIAVDETTALVLDSGRSRTTKGLFLGTARRREGCRSSVKMALFTPNR